VDQATGVRLNKPHKAADPRQGTQIRDRRSAAIAARKRALSEWDKANPGTAYDPAGDPAVARDRAAFRDHGGGRMFRRGGRLASWLASAFADTSQHKRGVLSLSTGPAALPTPTSTRG
jgi:hypothetical protein